MSDFISGFRYSFSGFGLISKPGIRLYVIVPLLINTFLFVFAIIYGANMTADFIKGLTEQWAWLEWISWLVWPLFFIIVMAVVFFCFAIAANLLAAPFNGFLSAAVERSLEKTPEAQPGNTGFFSEIIGALRSEAVKSVYFLLRAVPLLLLFIIPVLQIAAPWLWLFFGAWMLSLEYLEYPLGNQGKSFSEVRKQLSSDHKTVLGFGTGVILLTMVPVINFIAMPVAVSSATKLYLDKFRA